MTAENENSLLLDIYQSLGRVQGQSELILQEQGRVRVEATEIARSVAGVASDLSDAKRRVDSMEPHVMKMVGFRSQLSLAVVFVTAVVTGAINIIWIAVSHFNEIKTALREFLR